MNKDKRKTTPMGRKGAELVNFNIYEIEADIALAKKLANDNLMYASSLVDGSIKAISGIEGPKALHEMLADSKVTLETLDAERKVLDTRIAKAINDMNDSEDISATVSVGECLGEYNLLHTQITAVTETLLEVAVGGELW